MSTRSAIIQKTDSGYAGIYCHFDGYLSGVGKTLLKDYQDPQKVSQLITLGDISALGQEVDPKGPHSYNNPEGGVTVAYMRDRGEEGCKPKIGDSIESVAGKIGHDGYVYVFDGSKWSVNGEELTQELIDRD